MQNHALVNLAQQSVKMIIRRLNTERSVIFGEHNEEDYQNLVAVFARLNREQLNDENVEDLVEFVDYAIDAIAARYNHGYEIHPGTLNLVIMAIQALARHSQQPYVFHPRLEMMMPETVDFMVGIVEPMTQNLQLLALHHAPWVNPVFVAREAARQEREEAPGAETRIARTLAEFRAMGGDAMEANCPLCMEAFIEHSPKGRGPVFVPVVFHKDEKGKWFHPMHTVCVNDVKKEECPMCRVKVIWPKMMANRKTRRPNSEPTRSVKRSVKRSPRSPGRSPRSPGRSPRSPGRSPRSPKKRSPGRSPRSPKKRSPGRSVKRRSADF